MIPANSHVAAMASYALADLSVPEGVRLVSLAQNESAMPPSPLAIEAGRAALGSGQFYPDPDWTKLRAAIARVHGLPAGQILCGAGSMELIAALVQAYAGPGREVLSSRYAYAFFRTAAQLAQAPYREARDVELTVSVDALLEAQIAETAIVFVANPGNPTGTAISRAELERLRDGLDASVLLVIDEAYGEFAEDAVGGTFDLVDRGNTVVLRTFSKAYGLAGARVGWGLFPPGIAGEVRKVLNPNNIALASEVMAAAAMADQAYMREICAETSERRDAFATRLIQLGLDVPQSSTNFVLIRFADGDAADSANRHLRSHGVLMRGMAGYGLPECLRATIGAEADMDSAMETLTAWLEKEKG